MRAGCHDAFGGGVQETRSCFTQPKSFASIELDSKSRDVPILFRGTEGAESYKPPVYTRMARCAQSGCAHPKWCVADQRAHADGDQES